jgi:hypothetical protein
MSRAPTSLSAASNKKSSVEQKIKRQTKGVDGGDILAMSSGCGAV